MDTENETADEPDRTDSQQHSDEASEDTSGAVSRPQLSRRGALSALAGLGILGLGGTANTTAQGFESETVFADERIDVDGETVLELTGPRSFERDDGEELRDGGTVRAGSLNEIAESAIGATVSGGGFRREDGGNTESNRVAAHFGTVSGGAGNQAGGDGGPESGQVATVAGGLRNTASGSFSVVSGGASNEATGQRSVVSGGRNNEAADSFALVGGGVGNEAAERYTTVTGGTGNVASEQSSTVVGGRVNVADGQHSTVVGGRGNYIEGRGATVAGGIDNDAAGEGAFVAGGERNTADGEYSFAAGRGADADGNDGAIVFGDSSEEPIRAEESDAAYFQMPVHARSFNNTSSRADKRNLDPVDTETVLEDVEELDIGTWEFARADDGTHMGPTAEEFHETFALGYEDGTISTLDADGVALAAIQGLSERLDEREERIEELEAENERKDERIDDLESRLSALEAQIDGGRLQ